MLKRGRVNEGMDSFVPVNIPFIIGVSNNFLLNQSHDLVWDTCEKVKPGSIIHIEKISKKDSAYRFIH